MCLHWARAVQGVWVVTRHEPARIVLAIEAGEEFLALRSIQNLLATSDPATPILVLYNGGQTDLAAQIKSAAERHSASVVVRTDDLPARLDLAVALALLSATGFTGDLLFVRCGVDLPDAWDARLAYAARLDPAIATASPFCDVSPLFTLVWERVVVDLQRVNDLLVPLAPDEAVEVPVPLDCCVLLKGAAAQAVRKRSEPSSPATLDANLATLLRRIAAAGYAHALCPFLYVRKQTFDAHQRRLERSRHAEVARAARSHPLADLRQVLNQALRSGAEPPAAAGLPTQLHIVHGWGGGLERWVRDFCAHDVARRNLVLKAVGNWGQFGERLDLYDSSDLGVPLRSWQLTSPIESIALVSLEYRRILSGLVGDYAVEAILVSSLIGHSLDALDTGLDTTLVLHDYLPFCPAINIYYDGVCDACGPARLADCFEHNPHNQFFTGATAERWLELREAFFARLQRGDLAVVAPSSSVERHWRQLAPALDGVAFVVIPHGTTAPRHRLPSAPIDPDRPLRVLVLGSLAPHKGGGLLKEALPALTKLAQVFLVGCGKEGDYFAGRPGVEIVPHYEPAELSEILAGIAPDLGVLASVVPETFSYTLTELQELGIPPLVPERGSFADRVEEGVTGFFYNHSPAGLVARVSELAALPGRIADVRGYLREVQRLTVAEMIAKYHAVSPAARFDPRRHPGKVSACASAEPANARAAEPGPAPAVLRLDPAARFSDVYAEFGRYLRSKIAGSPRLAGWQRRPLLLIASVLFWTKGR